MNVISEELSDAKIVEGLNLEQKQAVIAPFSNLLVLAGAGSGKTRVLVHRISWLIEHEKVPLHSIIAVTFTNKAAKEMRARVASNISDNISGMWLGTFHGLAHKMLRMHSDLAGLPQNFQIIDSDDQLRLIRKIFKEEKISDEIVEPKNAQYYINRKKDEGIRASLSTNVLNEADRILSKIYYIYQNMCQANGFVDFAEILLRTYELLLNNEQLLSNYQQRFLHFLVDEFQDTNTIQYKWLKLLSAQAQSVTVVGDDDQSIYSWRGAKYENIYKFEKDFLNVIIIRLEQNYRSTENILSAANAVIKNNNSRLGKNLWTESKDGEPITLYASETEDMEAFFVVSKVKQHLDLGGRLSDVAVLYRSNAQSRILEEAFIRSGLPYKIFGGLRFFDRAEIKDALAYLKLAVNIKDNYSFERVVNVPPRGIGSQSLKKIKDLAEFENITLWDAAIDALDKKILATKAHNGVDDFVKVIKEISDLITKKTLPEIMDEIIHKSNLLSFYKNQKGEKAKNKVDNLEELVNATYDFFDEQSENSTYQEYNFLAIDEFLAYTSLEAGDYINNHQSSDSVQLMTLHSSKGLEFNVVFICGLEEGLFPHHFSKNSDEELEEERRLCYVGITRAQEKLFLTYANVRRLFGREEIRKPSRFIKEIPKTLLDEQGRVVNVHYPYKRSRKESEKINDYSGNYKKGKIKKANVVGAAVVGVAGFSIGSRVIHAKFGVGTVIDCEGEGKSARVCVRFEEFGTKWLILEYADLKKI